MLKQLDTQNHLNTFRTQIKGLVQGVGFRPFVYRLANELDIKGTVENRNDGVIIQFQCAENLKDEFIVKIISNAPISSEIHSIETGRVTSPDNDFPEFHIIPSADVSQDITCISPDIAVCADCTADLKHQEHRIGYPFINCTHCGPRFSIIRNLPYDRVNTTMHEFKMCEKCFSEYVDVSDRRFHAQPVACNHCGPSYTLHHQTGRINAFEEILRNVAAYIDAGKIITVKGLGGYHLACDALNGSAVSRLREIKKRDGKPFAVMFSDIHRLKEYTEVNGTEEKALQSWQRPILLLTQKKAFPEGVSVNLDTIGVMLPYLPIHLMLFEKLRTPAIVLTSGNVLGNPIVIDNDQAIESFYNVTDAVVTHNRDIYNRVDDSVQMVVNQTVRQIRRSRGFVPSPVRLSLNVDGILATGAELANCFCIGKKTDAYLSQHIGDLKNYETFEFYTETINRFKHLMRIEPSAVVCDLHPDYLSSRYAEDESLPVTRVQHHHAHIASCMAEHGLDEKVIGVAFDGTGLGTDGNIWGAEFFICDLMSFERIRHFDYIPMPGGDSAVEEPFRMGISYLYHVFGKETPNLDLAFIREIPFEKVLGLISAIQNQVNSPLCSSAGRLFDAAAAITGICRMSTFHAEAPMRLEAMIDHTCSRMYDYTLETTIQFNEMIRQIVQDIQQGVHNTVISAKFHNTIIAVIEDMVMQIKKKHNINKVVLSGGMFQNRYILAKLEDNLALRGFHVFTHAKVPSNDGGIALGQLIICGKMREMTCV